MTRKRIIIGISLVVVLAPAIIFYNYIYRGIRTHIIYSKHAYINNGIGYIYNQNLLNISTLPWGISTAELKFLISDRFLHRLDLRYPAMANLLEETENSVSYRFNHPNRTVVFYFNSSGRYYKAVQRWGPVDSMHTLRAFSWYNTMWMKKYLLGQMNWDRYYNGTFFEVKWINDTLASGFEHYTSDSGKIRDFVNIGGLANGTVSLKEYPGLEIYYRREFDGMIIEHFLESYPSNPSLMKMCC